MKLAGRKSLLLHKIPEQTKKHPKNQQAKFTSAFN